MLEDQLRTSYLLRYLQHIIRKCPNNCDAISFMVIVSGGGSNNFRTVNEAVRLNESGEYRVEESGFGQIYIQLFHEGTAAFLRCASEDSSSISVEQRVEMERMEGVKSFVQVTLSGSVGSIAIWM